MQVYWIWFFLRFRHAAVSALTGSRRGSLPVPEENDTTMLVTEALKKNKSQSPTSVCSSKDGKMLRFYILSGKVPTLLGENNSSNGLFAKHVNFERPIVISVKTNSDTDVVVVIRKM